MFLPLPSWGLPSFSVANLSDLDVATSGLCVSPVQARRLDELLLFVSSPPLTVPSIPAFLQTMLSCSQATIAGPFYFLQLQYGSTPTDRHSNTSNFYLHTALLFRFAHA